MVGLQENCPLLPREIESPLSVTKRKRASWPGSDIAKYFFFGRIGEQFRPGRFWPSELFNLNVLWNRNFFDGFTNLDQLCSTCFRVRFKFSPLCSIVGGTVVIDVAQQQIISGLMDDDANIAGDPHRPEVRITGAVKAMKLHSRMSGIELQVKRRRLHALLFLASEFRKAVCERVCDSKLHYKLDFTLFRKFAQAPTFLRPISRSCADDGREFVP